MSLTPKQVKFRKTGLGGSDAAAVLGLSPWQSPMGLWLEKTGRDPDGASKSSVRLDIGSFLEPFVVAQVMRGRVECHGEGAMLEAVKFGGLNVSPGLDCVRHPEHDFMIGNTDRCIPGVGSFNILEIKTSGSRQFYKGWKQGPPLYYQVQVQHYMAITGANAALIACLEGLDTVHLYEIERNDKFIEGRLIPALRDFWELVQTNTRPPADDSDSCARALSIMFPEPKPGKTVEVSEHLGAVAAEYDATKAEIRKLTKYEKGLKNQLADALEDAETGVTPDGVLVHRKKSGRGYTFKVEEPKEVHA